MFLYFFTIYYFFDIFYDVVYFLFIYGYIAMLRFFILPLYTYSCFTNFYVFGFIGLIEYYEIFLGII